MSDDPRLPDHQLQGDEAQDPSFDVRDDNASPQRGGPLPGLPETDFGAMTRALRALIDRTAGSLPEDTPPPYLNLAAAAEDLIFVIDLDGTIEYINPATASFLHVAPEDLIRQPFEKLSLLPPPTEAEDLLAQVISREETVRYEREMARGSGRRYLYTTLSPIRDRDSTMTGILGIAKDVTELARARDELRSLSMVDELTGIYNRRGFMSMAGQHLSLAQRSGSQICLIMIDVDNLKTINDRFGHKHGDEVLKIIASILRGNCRKSDVVARLGGDEFALLASGISEGGADFLIARLKQAVRIEDLEGGRPYRLSASLGAVESAPDPTVTIERLLAEADGRMYEAKRERANDNHSGIRHPA